jgi:glycosyltransferase involved in cell wall biosynthesis
MVTTFFGAPSFGGDAVYVERLAEALIRRGHEVHVVHSAGAFRWVRGLHQDRIYDPPPGLHVHTIAGDLRGMAAALWSHQTGRIGPARSLLAKVLAEVQFDVVHLHNVSLLGHAHTFEAIPPGQRPVKLVTAHDYWWICPQSLLWKNRRTVCDTPTCWTCLAHSGRPPQLWRARDHASRALAHANAVIFPSRSALETHVARGLRHPRMKVLPCFLPDDWTARAPAPSPSRRPYFAAVGRLIAEKNFQEIVPLMRELPNHDLRIAGSGPVEPRLRRLAAGLHNVKFLGQISGTEVAALLRGARALVVPSSFPETFGYVAAEALALGTPVIARRSGGLPELVAAAGEGLLYDSPDELRAHMHALAVDQTKPSPRAMPALAPPPWSESAHLEQYMQLIEPLR